MTEIDVSKCRFYAPLSGICNAETNIDSGYKYYCKNCKNCYYKQLQQLKQENDGLKSRFDYEIQKLEVENSDLDNQLNITREMMNNCNSKAIRLEQKLEKIKEYCKKDMEDKDRYDKMFGCYISKTILQIIEEQE